MRIYSIDMTFVNNIVFNNTSDGSGGGIYVESHDSIANLTVEDSFINNNVCVEDGGGIIVDKGSLTIVRSSFESNLANDVGGAIDIRTPDSVVNSVVINSTFIENYAVGGGAMSIISGQNVTITNALFIRNWALESGASIYLETSSAVSNITIFETVSKLNLHCKKL